MSLGFKWWLSDQKLVTEHTQTPQVYFFIMRPTLDHLWWQVIQSSAQSRPPLETDKHTQITSNDKIEHNGVVNSII